MAQRKRTTRKEDDYEQDLEWLVEETARLKVDVAGLVLSIPRAIIALARGQGWALHGGSSGDAPPSEEPPRTAGLRRRKP